MKKSINKYVAICVLVLCIIVLIPCIFNSIYCFKFNVVYGLLSIISCILLLLMIIMLFTHKKILKYTSIFLFSFSFIFFVVYHCTYKNSSEYRFKRIDYLYSKIYTKTKTEKGDGWVIFNNSDGKPSVYYDENKTHTETNKNKILDKITREKLRVDLPEVENISWNDEGIITWDDIEVDNSFIVYDVYVNDKKIWSELYLNTFKLSITQNSYEIKIIAREKEQKYYNESATTVTINYNVCTVTVVNVYGEKINVEVVNGKKFEVGSYKSETYLYDNQLYYDKAKTSKCPDAILVNQNMTLYEGAKDFVITSVSHIEINPNYYGVLVIPENCKYISLKDNVTFPYITGLVYKYEQYNNIKNIKKLITKCPNLQEDAICKVNPNYTNIRCIDDFVYADNSSSETKLIKYINYEKKDVIIPSIAMHIDDKAFMNCTNIESILISSSILTIGSNAFANCNNLKCVKFEEGSQLNKMYYNVFLGCNKIEKMYLPFIGNGESTFSSDKKGFLGYIFGADKYEDNPNYVPKSLKEVVVLNGATALDGYAFYMCTSLEKIVLPNGIKYIPYQVFYGCTNLLNVEIPNSVKGINSQAFYNCINIKKIIITNNVTHIDSNAFYGCNSLTIYCEASYKKTGWSSDWNSSNCDVVWNYKQV